MSFVKLILFTFDFLKHHVYTSASILVLWTSSIVSINEVVSSFFFDPKTYQQFDSETLFQKVLTFLYTYFWWFNFILLQQSKSESWWCLLLLPVLYYSSIHLALVPDVSIGLTCIMETCLRDKRKVILCQVSLLDSSVMQ